MTDKPLITANLDLGDAPLTPEEQEQLLYKRATKAHKPDSLVNTDYMRKSHAYRIKVWEEGGIYEDEGGRRFFRTNRGWQNDLKRQQPTPVGGFWTFDGEQKFWVDFAALQMRYHRNPDPKNPDVDLGGHYRIWANVKILKVDKSTRRQKKKTYIWEGETRWVPLSYWFASESEIRTAMATLKETHEPLARYNPFEHYHYCPDELIESFNEEYEFWDYVGSMRAPQPTPEQVKWERIWSQNELLEEELGIHVLYGELPEKHWIEGYDYPVRDIY